MVVLHAFLALAAGFLTMALLVSIMTLLLNRLTPSWVAEGRHPEAGYIFVNLGYSFLAAVAGGYITGWIAGHNPLIHVLVLAIAALLLAALSALQHRGQQPVWYLLTLVAITPMGVLAGGLIRLRVLGVL
jgi:hypothetical protein